MSDGSKAILIVGRAIAFVMIVAAAFGAYWLTQAWNTPKIMNVALFCIFLGGTYKILGIDIP